MEALSAISEDTKKKLEDLDVFDDLLDNYFDEEFEGESEICPDCKQPDNYVIYKSDDDYWVYQCACGHKHIIINDEI